MSRYLSSVWSFIQARKRIICIIAPALLGLLFMILCIVQLQQSIWFDESYSAYLTRFEYPKIWELTSRDVHPPLYYFALKTWAHFFGHTDFAMRMLSVVFGAVAILFAFLWIKYKYGATSAVLATTLLAISPSIVRYGQEMRMYTMVLAIVFAATYVLQLAIDNGKKRWWILYAILLAAGMWTHYFCAFAWIAHLAYLVSVYHKKIFQKRIVLTYVGAVALFLPWAPSLIMQTGAVQSGFWIPEMTAQTVLDYWTESVAYESSWDLKNWLLMLTIIATIYIISLIVKYRTKMKLLLYIMLIPLAILITVSMPPLESMFIPRYILFAIAAIALVAGVALSYYIREPLTKRFSQKRLKRRVISASFATLVLFGASISGLVSVYSKGNYNFSTLTKSASKDLFETIVTLDGDQNLPIISASEWLYFDLAFYETKETPVYFMNEVVDYKYGSQYPLRDTKVGRIDDLDKFISKRDSFWYITTIDKETNEPATKFPRKDWSVLQYSAVNFNEFSDTYAIVKMVKQ
ncbi:MAG: glycosyltransferase family 39 protein [Candidatus Saccharibacteria bacterium]|nr:glycosyltransferase family 39 protein [Candidatus Saccharibacteria bacterium]